MRFSETKTGGRYNSTRLVGLDNHLSLIESYLAEKKPMIIYLSLCQTFSVAVSYLSAILSHDWTVELEFWQWRIVEGPDSSLICAGKCTIIHVFEVKCDRSNDNVATVKLYFCCGCPVWSRLSAGRLFITLVSASASLLRRSQLALLSLIASFVLDYLKPATQSTMCPLSVVYPYDTNCFGSNSVTVRR